MWGDENDDDLDPDNEESDRLYTFEVAKTNEQEENVSIRPGFQVFSQLLVYFSSRLTNCIGDFQ